VYPFGPAGAVTEAGRNTIPPDVTYVWAALSSQRSVSSASAIIPAARRSNHSLPWLASIEAFAAILVPSIATVPNRPKPASAAIINT
jgi:hypothetical protein